MRCSILTVGVALIVATAKFSYAAPAQWSSNGHYYDLVSPPGGITWTNAVTAAAATSFQGQNGHLVTFSSQNEWTFVQTTFPQSFTWIGFTDQVTEGTYKWVNAEPVVFTAWLANEPNNAASGAGEDYAWYEQRDGQWGWNDYQNVTQADTGPQQFPIGFVVEFDTVPEPSTLALLGAACGVFLVKRRRNRNHVA